MQTARCMQTASTCADLPDMQTRLDADRPHVDSPGMQSSLGMQTAWHQTAIHKGGVETPGSRHCRSPHTPLRALGVGEQNGYTMER
jgi:hypothetical protein